MPHIVEVPDNIALHTGPMFIGSILNWWFYGILCVQYYLWMTKTKNELKVMKFIVHIIFILDTFQTFFIMEDSFYGFVYNFGGLSKLNEFHFSPINMALVDAIIAVIVQSVYCWRINRLGGWRVVPIIIMLTALIAFGSGIFIAIMDLKFQNDVAFDPSFYIGVTTWLFPSAATDIMIALATGYLLYRMNKHPLSKSFSKKVLRLLTLTLETNAITAAVACEIMIIYFVPSIAPPTSKLDMPGGYVLGKLYSNCFMILLNQRHNYYENTIESSGGGVSADGRPNGVNSGVVSAIQFAPGGGNTDTIPAETSGLEKCLKKPGEPGDESNSV